MWEQVVEIALPIGDVDPRGLGTLSGQGLRGGETVQPLRAFLLLTGRAVALGEQRPKWRRKRAQPWAWSKPSGCPAGVRAKVECRNRPMVLSGLWLMGPRPWVCGWVE